MVRRQPPHMDRCWRVLFGWRCLRAATRVFLNVYGQMVRAATIVLRQKRPALQLRGPTRRRTCDVNASALQGALHACKDECTAESPIVKDVAGTSCTMKSEEGTYTFEDGILPCKNRRSDTPVNL